MGRPVALFTDQRLKKPEQAAAQVPAFGFVILRGLTDVAQDADAQRLEGLAKRRCLNVAVSLGTAGGWNLAERLGGQGVRVGYHVPEASLRDLACRGQISRLRLTHRQRGRPLTMACHSRQALAHAVALRADVAFLSPLFPTASHPGAPSLGPVRGALMLRSCRRRAGRGPAVLGLGGITGRTGPAVLARGFAGYAAVGAWLEKP